jgi:hypothetical protein
VVRTTKQLRYGIVLLEIVIMLSEKKNCPFCAEEIQSAAIKCKHCHTMLNDASKKIDNKIIFVTDKIYFFGSGTPTITPSGTLTMYSDYMNYIPDKKILVRGRELYLKYEDIISTKRPFNTKPTARIQTRYGEDLLFQAAIWNKSHIEKFLDMLRSKIHI